MWFPTTRRFRPHEAAALRSAPVSGKPPAKATTAPKGRPTRSRNGGPRNRRTFGSTFQWIGLVAVLVVVFLIGSLLF